MVHWTLELTLGITERLEDTHGSASDVFARMPLVNALLSQGQGPLSVLHLVARGNDNRSRRHVTA